jgi:NAD(P)-dependent dehydrogenase (short-subunit alcohol dehydrogenase family)
LPIPDLTDRAIADLVSLEARVAVVTGATNGTGAGIAVRLAQAGATVVITDRDAGTATDAARSMAAHGLSIHGFELDVREERAFAELASGVAHEHGPIGIWVNNAGIYPGSAFLDMTASEWDEVLDHNLRSAFLGSRTAAQQMVQAGRGGVIVNVGSTASFRAPSAGMSHYVSSKFGLRGLTQALAVELGPHQIRVLGVAPTFTETEGTRARRADLDDDAYRRFIDKVGATKPLRRVGVPDDVARVVLFCASDLSSFMTGATLPVDGGDLA